MSSNETRPTKSPLRAGLDFLQRAYYLERYANALNATPGIKRQAKLERLKVKLKGLDIDPEKF